MPGEKALAGEAGVFRFNVIPKICCMTLSKSLHISGLRD